MATVDDIDAQIEELKKKRAEAAKKERADDLNTVKTLIKKHGFTDITLEKVLKKGKRRKPKAEKPD